MGEKDDKENNLDNILSIIGMGKWQMLIFLINILIWSVNAPHTMGSTLFNAPVQFRCFDSMESACHYNEVIRNNHTEPIYDNRCLDIKMNLPIVLSTTVKESCDGVHETSESKCPFVIYDSSIFSTTVTTDWDLICESKIKRPLFQNAYTFGNIIGCLLAGSISDSIGRARTIFIGSVIHVIFSVLVVVLPSYSLVLVCRILVGISNLLVLISAVTCAIETCPSSWRGPVGMFVGLPYSIWVIVFACASYYIRNWSHLYIAIVFPGLILIPVSLALDESPRWLLQKGKHSKASEILLKAARINKVKAENVISIQEQLKEIKEEFAENIPCESGVLKDEEAGLQSSFPDVVPNLRRNSQRLWKISIEKVKVNVKTIKTETQNFLATPMMRRISIVTPLARCLGELVYYGIIFNANNFSSDNPFIYVALNGVADAIAVIIGVVASKSLSRKVTVGGGLLASGLFLILVLGIPVGIWVLQWICVMTGFLTCAVASQGFYVYQPELFPTALRGRGFAFCNLMGNVGVLIAPLITDLSTDVWWATSAILGSSGLIAGSLIFILPETKEKPLCETVNDIEKRGL